MSVGVIKSYGETFTCCRKTAGVIGSALAITAIVSYILLCSGHLSGLPQDILRVGQSINYTHLAVGVVVTTVLIAGAAIVIHRARTKQEILRQNGNDQVLMEDRGAFRNMEKHLLEVHIRCSAWQKPEEGYIDLSTLKNGTGKAYIYGMKACSDHYVVSTAVPLLTPIYMIGVIVYNLLRTAIVPFYILGAMLAKQEREFELKDIPSQIQLSLWRVVKAPFFALAFFLSGMYSLVNPMGGRKLASKVEFDWNDGVSRAEGFWSIQGWQSTIARWEGEKDHSSLGRNGYFLAGCWQPMGVVEYQNGKIVKASSLSKAVSSDIGHDFTINI